MIKNLILSAFSVISAVPSVFAVPTLPTINNDPHSHSHNYLFLFTGAIAFIFTVGGLIIGLKLSRNCLRSVKHLIESTHSVLDLNDDRLINQHLDNRCLLRKVNFLVDNTDSILCYLGQNQKATFVSNADSEKSCCCSSEKSCCCSSEELSGVTDEESECSSTDSVVTIIEADVLVHKAALPSTEVFETSVNEESSNNNISYVTSM